MASKKKIEKSVETIGKQIEKHKEKIKEYEGKNYALIEYWEGEIEAMEKEKVRRKRVLKG